MAQLTPGSIAVAICFAVVPSIAQERQRGFGSPSASLSADGWSIESTSPLWEREYAKRVSITKESGGVRIETRPPGIPVPVVREIPTLADLLVSIEIVLPPLESLGDAKPDSGEIVLRIQSVSTPRDVLSVTLPAPQSGKETRHHFLCRREKGELMLQSARMIQKREIEGPIRIELRLLGRTEFRVKYQLDGKPKSDVAAMKVSKGGDHETQVKLPGPVDQVVLAGGGRFLALHSRQIGKLIVFDIEAKQIARIETVGGSVVLAGGAEHLVVIDRESGVLSRYRIDPFKREKSVVIPKAENVLELAMGSRSHGPILMASKQSSTSSKPKLTFRDLQSLKPMAVSIQPEPSLSWGTGSMLRASDDGRVFGISGGRSCLILQQADKYESIKRTGIYRVIPGPLGNQIFTNEGVANQQLIPSGTANRSVYTWFYPATRGPFYVSLQPVNSSGSHRAKQLRVELRLPQRGMSVAVLNDMRIKLTTSDPNRMPLDRRVIYHPPAKVLVQLADTNDRLLIREVDPLERLRNSGEDFLLVASQPPASSKAETLYQYQIRAISNQEPIKYALTSAPEGMTVSDTGEIRWNIPPEAAGSRQHVIVTLTTESGESIYHTFPLQVAGAPMAKEEPPIDETPLVQERAIQLPAKFSNVAVSAGGRMLIFNLPSIQKLAFVDLQERKIAKYLSVPEGAICAGGLEKFVIVIPGEKLIQRRDIKTFKPELTITLDAGVETDVIAMGSASRGPILLGGGQSRESTFQLFDLDQLRPIPLDIQQVRGNVSFALDRHSAVRVSAHGHVFSAWRTATSPSGFALMTVDGSTAQVSYDHASVGYIAPGADGSRIYTSAGIYLPNLRLLDDLGRTSFAIPGTEAGFYLRVERLKRSSQSKEYDKPSATVYIEGNAGPIMTLPDLNVHAGGEQPAPRDSIGIDQRILLVASEKLLVTLPDSNDLVVLREVDVMRELMQGEIDYLFVDTRPPRKVTVGQQFDYQIGVTSKRGDVRYKLESGPPGMAVDRQGRVSWKVQPVASNQIDAMIVVSDSSQREVFHTFQMLVEKKPAAAAKPPTVPGPHRTWTAASGIYSVNAALVRRVADKIYLRKLGGEELVIEVKQLSERDQKYLREQTIVDLE